MSINRRDLMIAGAMLAARPRLGMAQSEDGAASASSEPPGSPPTILLDDYFPQSIFRIPVTEVPKAKFPVFDGHDHGHGPLSVTEMVRIMDKVGVEKTVIFTGASTVDRFNQVASEYSDHPGRFDLWCMFDLRGVDQGGFGPDAIKSLEECHRAGAKGIGELHDKGWGLSSPFFSGQRPPAGASSAQRRPASTSARSNTGGRFTRDPQPPNPNTPIGPHADDPRMDSLWEKAGQLGMPISIHVSDPIWSYQPLDNTNDGLMAGWTWRIVVGESGMYDHNQLVDSLEKTAKKHLNTLFIACHLCNLDYDLTRLGEMFDRNPNLYADISGRFSQTGAIPRAVHRFLVKYSDRVVYGTDITYNEPYFGATFRILQTEDEHFYMRGKVPGFNYHWTLNGFGLPDDVLKKIYRDNMDRIVARAEQNRA